jgi:PAS domain S-box-containing protein
VPIADLPSQPDDSRYRLLVEGISDYAIYMLDPQGHVSSWNAGASRFKGYSPEEIIGAHFSRFYSPGDVASGLPDMGLATAAREGRFESEGWRLRKDGGRFWAHVVIDAIRDDAGALLGFAKITRDLTERRAAEEALRHSEQQFRLLVQSVTDYALFMLDAEGRVTNWNAGAERIKGYAAGEIVGEHFSRFYTSEDRDAGLPAKALAVAASEGRFEKEGWRVRRDGSRFWAHVVIDPVRDSLGEVIGYAKITRDITERREAQEALDQTREALFQAQKMEAIGRLTGGVAHDFNNLLMAILGSLELLRKRLPDDARMLGLLDNAVQGAQRGASLTQRMLAFARKQDLSLEPVDVAALVKGMEDLMRRLLGPSVVLDVRLADGLPVALTDANQMEMALLNLVLNARDALQQEGQIAIEVTHARLPPSNEVGLAAGDYVALSVIDNGAGMDPQSLARAGEPFYTTKGVGKGTGLGLPMVLGFAEQSGGRLRLSSESGRGTRADVWLPMGIGPATQPRRDDAGDPLGMPAQAVPSQTVLVVDDDALVLLNTVAMLEDLGQRVLAAGSATDALAQLADHRVDLLITDYAMPGLNGLDLIEAVRRRDPDLTVVLATGYAELPPGVGGAFLKLSKPYGLADLARILRLTAGRSPETTPETV